MKLSGVIPPVIMPAADDGLQIDRSRLQKLARWLLDAGVNGLFIGATAGESAMLDRAQRQAALETVIAEVQGAVPVIAGVSAISTAQSLQYAKDAEAAGANYIMGLPPGVFPLTDDDMIRHFATVADSVSIPALLYNFPGISGGQKITPKIAAALSQKSRVVGVKDSSGDISNTRAYRRECGDDFALLMGADPNVCAHLALGGDGMICSGANMFPKTYIGLYKAFRAGDMQKAIALQDALGPIADLCGTGTFPAGVKFCLTAQGVPVGPPFLPVSPVTPAQAASVQKFFNQITAASQESGVG